MKTSTTIIVVFAAVSHIITAAPPPAAITKCSISDPKFDECQNKLTQDVMSLVIKGVPELGIPVLDPFAIEKLVLGEQGSDAEPLSLSLLFKNVKVTGFKKIQMLDGSRVNLKKQKFEFQGLLPSLQIEGTYLVDGRVLLLPIKGEGHANITVGDLIVKYETDFTTVKQKDGKRKFVQHDVQIDLQPKTCHIQLDNLFNGDKNLGDTMNKFLNENWRDVLEEFGPAIKATAKEIINFIFSGAAKHITYEDLYIE